MSVPANQQAAVIFEQASGIDPGLTLPPARAAALNRLRIRPTRWDRGHLFRAMGAGRPVIYGDFPAPLYRRAPGEAERVAAVLEAMECTELDYRIRTRVGRHRQWRYFTPPELARRWRRGRSPINVTDFHFLDTPVGEVIDHRVLSDFNLLPLMTEAVAWIEMMTLVVSGAGGFSDSHSDDCDGSNHCFTGRKLWLAWDTAEGLSAGLEDLDQQRIDGAYAFDMTAWSCLESACWFTVGAGQTLFMPGHLTHKVITLEPYLGVGSFYIGFPNLVRTLARWQAQQPNWERLEARGMREAVYREVPATALKKLRSLRRGSAASQARWGADRAGGFLGPVAPPGGPRGHPGLAVGGRNAAVHGAARRLTPRPPSAQPASFASSQARIIARCRSRP